MDDAEERRKIRRAQEAAYREKQRAKLRVDSMSGKVRCPGCGNMVKMTERYGCMVCFIQVANEAKAKRYWRAKQAQKERGR